MALVAGALAATVIDLRTRRIPNTLTAAIGWSYGLLNADQQAVLRKLSVFAGVRQYPARVKCASLAWHTLRAATEARNEVVSTE